MSTSSISLTEARPRLAARLADLCQLTRPRIALLELLTVAVGAFAATWGAPEFWPTLHALAGTALVAASASALNQWLERAHDEKMPRTFDRPLPSGRLAPAEAVAFGAITVVAGLVYLGLAVGAIPALLAAFSWLAYVALYTPLKRRSSANTAVGAVAGALPALVGWTSTGAPLNLAALTLLVMIYLWQFPHFMAIAWIYRRDYAQAGMQMLTVVDPSGRRAGRQAVVAALVLVPVSMLPATLGYASPVYLVAALFLSIGYAGSAAMFAYEMSDAAARRLVRHSLVYLPAVLVIWLIA